MRPYIVPRKEQFGFRHMHSTTLQLTRVIHELAHEMNNGKHTVTVFLDIEKAFDRVWHEGLLFKLLQTETPDQYIRIIESFLKNRSFYVTVEGNDSTTRSIQAGVPQGSCISPGLYALYTNDIPTLADRIREEERDVTLALFADDSAYLSTSRTPKGAVKRMQKLLNILPEWLDDWRMAVNVNKTAAMLVGPKRKNPPQLALQGKQIEWKNSVKYLGVEIDRRLTMAAQTEQAVRQARTARALLYPVLRSKLPTRTKLGIYKTYVRSRLTYAAPAWHHLCAKSNKKKIQAQQNVALRIITGAGRYVRNDTIAKDVKIESVDQFVTRLSKRMFDSADNGPHVHLHGIAPLHARPPDARKTWRALPREVLPSREAVDNPEG